MLPLFARQIRCNRVQTTIAGGVILICLAAFFRQSLSIHQWQSAWAAQDDSTHNELVVFGHALFDALERIPPPVPTLERNGDAQAMVFWRADSSTPRPDLLNISPSQVANLREAHDAYREHIKKLHIPYRSKSHGIVSTAGGAYLPIFIVSLRMLRRTGCNLPVELLLTSVREYESYLCDTILPSLNAQCVRLDHYVGDRITKLAKFQLKVFSIIFSSFENILFLDADDYLVKDPEPMFTQEPFLTTGLVTWPDFWASTTSKYFYEIQSKSVPLMNAFPSSESGQLLVSKGSQGAALLMAAYYNFYGPGRYYELLSQGAFGEGDKETYVAGAEAVGAPYYQVKKVVDTIGYYEDGRYHGVAMLQYDPLQDETASTANDHLKPQPFAVHHNYPKLDPVKLFAADGAAINHATGEYHRLLGPKNLTEERFGRDVEHEMWEEIRYVACELGDKFEHWHTVLTTDEQLGTCDIVEEYRAALFDEALERYMARK